MINVYYVTAVPSNGTDRLDLGKFFTHADAQAHADGLSRRWHSAQVDVREESSLEQHPSHADSLR